MGFTPLKNEFQSNYAVVVRPQPLLARVRRYFGDRGGNAMGVPQDPGRAAGFCLRGSGSKRRNSFSTWSSAPN